MWKDLTMSQRADMMDLYLSKGITSLDDMRSLYDNSISDTAQGTSFSDGGSIHTNPGMTGMMKAKLATAAHYGNPTARRMANYDGRDYVWSGEYEYDKGIGEPRRGNVYVGSYDNLVTPRIQDTGNGLTYIDNVWSPENDQRSYMQSLKFNNEKDARYFGEHYKEIAPMMSLYSNGGSIHIDPAKKGTFTTAAKKHGMGVQEFASRVLANKEDYSPAMVKKANFARNASKWHGYGGNLYPNGGLLGALNKVTRTIKGEEPGLIKQALPAVLGGGLGYMLANDVPRQVVVRNLYNKLVPVGYQPITQVVKAGLGLSDDANRVPLRDDFWAEYLEIPESKRHNIKNKTTLSPADYRPTKGTPDPRTFKINNLSKEDKDVLIERTYRLANGENKGTKENNTSFDALGNFTVGRGYDSQRGSYVSYYDRWDLTPFNNGGFGTSGGKDQSFGLGHPYDVYDRIYLDDYYNIPQEYRGSMYLPGVTKYGTNKKKKAFGGHIYDGTTEDSQQMDIPRYRKLLNAEIKEELSDSDVMELPLAAELSDVRVTGKKKRNVFSQIEEKWIKNDKGEEVPTYWGYNPTSKQYEQLYKLTGDTDMENSVFSTYDNRHTFNVPQAIEMRKAHEQWVKNGAYARYLDRVMAGTLGLGLAPIALPEAATGIWAASQTPAGQTLLAGTLGGEAWEALNHGITGQSWGDNLGDVIGLDKDNYWGRTTLGLTNPFYGLSPSMIYRSGEAVLGAGKTALDLAKNTTSKSVEALQMTPVSRENTLFSKIPQNEIEGYFKEIEPVDKVLQQAAKQNTSSAVPLKDFFENQSLGVTPEYRKAIVQGANKADDFLWSDGYIKRFDKAVENLMEEPGNEALFNTPEYTIYMGERKSPKAISRIERLKMDDNLWSTKVPENYYPAGYLENSRGNFEDALGLYNSDHRIGIDERTAEILNNNTPEHEFYHAMRGNFKNKDIIRTNNKKYQMDHPDSYYRGLEEQRVRVLSALREMQDAGININNLTDDVIDSFFAQPKEAFSSNTLDLITRYDMQDIKKALKGFLGYAAPIGITYETVTDTK